MVLALLSLAAATLTVATPHHAQSPAQATQHTTTSTTEAATQPARAALDLPRLLTDGVVTGQNLDTPLWTLEPQTGRSSLLVPLTLEAGDQPTRWTDPPIDLAGARFVAWYVPTDEANADNFNRPGGGFAGRPGGLGGGLERDAGFPGNPGRGNAPNAYAPDQLGPRLTRAITVHPVGKVTWELDRNIAGATLSTGDNPYALKLSPARLRELAPEREDRLTRNSNESSREFAERQRAARLEQREAQEAYRQVRDQVSSLPEAFSAEPSVVWAVFEMPDNRREVTLEGPDPLPWSLPVGAFEALRGLAGGGGGVRGGGAGSFDAALPDLQAALATEHPLSRRAVAIALSASGALNGEQAGNAAVELAEAVLNSGDGPAVRTVVNALAAVDRPTPTTNRLLDVASRTDDPIAKLVALQATLRGQVDNPATVARVVQQADAVLSDPNGPPPAQVLAGLASTTNLSDVARQALQAGVRFENLPTARRAEAIDYICLNAQDPEGLPAAWLDQRLLGSSDPAVVRATLDRLTAGSTGPSRATPFVRGLRRAVFGGNGQTQDNATNTDASSNEDDDRAPVRGVALTSADHGLFNALRSGDPEIQALAWDALAAFTVETPRGRRGNGEQGDPLAMIIDAATSQPSVPTSLVTFLERQPQGAQTTAALMQLAGGGDGRLAGRAVRVLLRPAVDERGRAARRGFDQALRELTLEQRVGFAQAIYTHAGGGATPVANLAADDRAASWFARQLDAGVVPAHADWLESIGGETRALDMAGGEDDTTAHGALAALAAAAGADAAGQLELIDRIGQPPRSPDAMQTGWADAKRSIQTARLRDAAGDHRLTLEILEGAPSAEPTGYPRELGFDDPAAPAPPVAANNPADSESMRPRKIVLGVVELVVDNDTVRLVGDPVSLTVPEDKLALRIEEPQQLANFPSDDIAEVPLANVTPPIDLTRTEAGAWQGDAAFGETHTLRVTMEPVE